MSRTVTRRDDGLVVIGNGDAKFLITIPSRGRAERIVRNPFFALANIFVNENEYDQYKATFDRLGVWPGALVPHYVGNHLGRIRNVMLDAKRDEDWVTWLDDDYAGMQYLFTLRSAQSRTSDVRKIIDIFTHTFYVADDAGAGMFCYAQTPTPWERHSFMPFRLRGWGQGGCMHIMDTANLRVDENLPLKTDIDICLQALAHHKVLIQDMRWWGWCDEADGRSGADVGGVANVRTTESEAACVAYLQQKWGENVVSYKGAKKRGVGITVRVRIPQSYNG